MAEITRIVCDACGRGETDELLIERVEVKTATFTINLDAHNNTRCLARGIRTAVEKHFNGTEPA